MKNSREIFGYLLLPHYCKKIGWLVIALGLSPIVVGLVCALAGIPAKQVFGNFSFDVMNHLMIAVSISGVFIIIVSAEKEEDERVRLARNKAMAGGFIGFIMLTILGQLFKIFDPAAYLTSYVSGHEASGNNWFYEAPGIVLFTAFQYQMIFRYYRDEE